MSSPSLSHACQSKTSTPIKTSQFPLHSKCARPYHLKPNLRYAGVLLLLSGSLLLQRSDAQNTKDDAVPNYSFRVSLPPVVSQEDILTLPDLPLYDRDNIYLQVRNTSKDWYVPKILEQDHTAPQAISQTFASELQGISSNRVPHASTKYLLDPEKRILPVFKSSDVLLDETLVSIPPQ